VIKNLTPERITLLTTLVLSIIFSGFLLYFRVSFLEFLISIFTFGSLTYIIILFGLEVFIYRKIKLIYKTIHHFKTTQKKNINYMADLNLDPIKKVNEEVIQWANDQREEITELRATEQYRKDFLGNVSHELKTPIFNIQGYIETLLDGAVNDEEVKIKFLKKAASSAERLNTLVNDLLDISKLESGTLHMHYSSFDINELTKDVFDSYSHLAELKSIKLKIKEGCDFPFKVSADKDRIRQVLNNLVGNAIAYGKEEGVTRVGFYDMDQNILTEVSDDGEGIEPEHLPRLFERFYRTDKSRSRNSGGSGLGLSIVKHILEAHNQTINVRSTVGEGTTFGFTLKKA
jgi:two-component system, OmpR family, phosphate regulon sensor histidine kinase PhoR